MALVTIKEGFNGPYDVEFSFAEHQADRPGKYTFEGLNGYGVAVHAEGNPEAKFDFEGVRLFFNAYAPKGDVVAKGDVWKGAYIKLEKGKYAKVYSNEQYTKESNKPKGGGFRSAPPVYTTEQQARADALQSAVTYAPFITDFASMSPKEKQATLIAVADHFALYIIGK